ncbi:phytanoyl-CoA dioxygenase domain-containing protein 1 [Exaiptasia diaphana]|uniref:Phytanoyl-CoA dioxygenase n=1 Tax=Exaiptasia diaphana TaxID=2652724 RepID=A0A913YCP8_EXADI|nr:phytanoyl-CoA dioxygenase domain-containing protein 1 [Exaiptasia diaphana]KXJ18610.1 Phytanoyl-CoA dioxygenase domain-containing protein 1 [Exaiptasia diaphana]
MEKCGLTQSQIKQFEDDGYLIIEDFYSADEVEALRKEMHDIVDKLDLNRDPMSVFKTGNEQVGDDYFLSSSDKIRAFLEKGAFNDKGELVKDKHLCINKVGHALHVLNPVFKDITFSDRIKAIARSLDLKNPVIPQSMYIFKQPSIGGEVLPHRDSTYLYTEPPSALGVWIPLQDCTKDNGCLWFLPGSHKVTEIKRRLIRTPDKTDRVVEHVGPDHVFDENDFKIACTKKGCLVLIHGSVLHRSFANTSSKSRHAYSFHMIDGDAKYSEQNWLQTPGPFPSLYDTT